ncbi:MAG: hypothetical protein AB7N76_28635 [Planctomycetota bacterium]
MTPCLVALAAAAIFLLVARELLRLQPAFALRAEYCPSLEVSIQRAKVEVVASRVPLRVVVLRAALLPHGGLRWAQLTLRAGGQASLEVAAVGHLATSGERRRVELEPAIGEQLGALVAAFAAAEVPRFGEGLVHDGAPVELALVEGGAPPRVAAGNLAAVAPDERTPPPVELARALLALSAELLGGRSLVGGCDARGQVTLQEL